jgi:hypothetical protein
MLTPLTTWFCWFRIVTVRWIAAAPSLEMRSRTEKRSPLKQAKCNGGSAFIGVGGPSSSLRGVGRELALGEDEAEIELRAGVASRGPLPVRIPGEEATRDEDEGFASLTPASPEAPKKIGAI